MSMLVVKDLIDKKRPVLFILNSDAHRYTVGEKIVLLPRRRRLRYPVVPASVQDMAESLEVFKLQNNPWVVFIYPPPYK